MPGAAVLVHDLVDLRGLITHQVVGRDLAAVVSTRSDLSQSIAVWCSTMNCTRLSCATDV